MRTPFDRQYELGQTACEAIQFESYCRDDITAIPMGLQDPHRSPEALDRVMALVGEGILPKSTSRATGRPGMPLRTIPVPGVLEEGLDCDFDRVRNLASHQGQVRTMLGHGDFLDRTPYRRQTVIDNVSLLTPDASSARRWSSPTGQDVITTLRISVDTTALPR